MTILDMICYLNIIIIVVTYYIVLYITYMIIICQHEDLFESLVQLYESLGVYAHDYTDVLADVRVRLRLLAKGDREKTDRLFEVVEKNEGQAGLRELMHSMNK